MTEVLFYHLQRRPLEEALPALLLRSLERGWKVTVEVGDAERLLALDDHLWTFSDDSFLPHGSAREPGVELQPVALVDGPQNPNGATVRFLVHGARLQPDGLAGLERVVLMFDGSDEAALANAREDWLKVKKTPGLSAAYWRQNDGGRWEKMA